VNEIVTSSQKDHEALHQALVERMVAELRPIRRLWPVSVRLLLWIALELGILLLLVRHGYRPDLAEQLRNPWHLLGFGGFAACGVIAAGFALRTAIPGREIRATEMAALLLLTGALCALLLFAEPINANVSLRTFIDTGLPCALGIAICGSLPWLALLWAVRRGAPLAAVASGVLTGAAALLFSCALMRVYCPIDERLHLLVWHFVPAVAGIVLSAFAGFVLMRSRIR
jgi:hypothetical protein